VRAREPRGRAAGLGAQRALHAADAHQLVGLLSDDPLLLCLVHVNDHRSSRSRRRRGRGRRRQRLLRGSRRQRQLRRVVAVGRRGVVVGAGDEVGAADGAGDVGGEPRVDAVRVEDVGALGQQAQRLVVVELAEAHGALERALAGLVRLHVGVRHGGEGLQHGGVEPALLAPGPRGGAVGAGRVRGVAAVAAGVAVADVDGEEAEEEEGGDEHHDDDGHGRAEALLLVVSPLLLLLPLLALHRREIGGSEQEKEEGQEAAAAIAPQECRVHWH